MVVQSGQRLRFQYRQDLINLNGNNITWEVYIFDRGNQLTVLNNQEGNPNQIQIVDPPLPPETEDITTIITTDEDGNIVTIVTPVDDLIPDQATSNMVWIILGFIGGLVLLILYYQRHNIKDLLERSARKKKVQGTLRELTDEIKRLGEEGKYKQAILLTWEALERVSREIIQTPRRPNQSAREFAAYLSTITIVEQETLFTLSSAFEIARYGKDNPTRDDWNDAVKSLMIIVQTIIESGASMAYDEDEDF